jgi:polysaccharide export outer membrane protein
MNKSIQVPVFAVLLSLFLAAGSSWAEQASPIDGYQIQPGDILAVSVWREPDLEREVLVRPDGGFAFPLAGDVRAEGRTVDQLREALVEKLTRYVPDPVVTVSLQQMTGNRIYVLGRVQRPGEFNVVRPVSVLQALAMAGGLTPYADEEAIQVMRGAGANQQSMPFNYTAVAEGVGIEQNVLLQPGDVVMVP